MPRDVRSVRAWTCLAAATACVLLAFAAALAAQTGYQPSPENLKSRAWFEQARFGLFVHWGIYSELGAGEWVMQTHHLSGPQYEQLAAQFYPVKFDAVQWVALAKQAGVRYIVVTSRHHDGFSMFATKQSNTTWRMRRHTAKMLSGNSPMSAIARTSSSSFTTRSSTGIIPTTPTG